MQWSWIKKKNTWILTWQIQDTTDFLGGEEGVFSFRVKRGRGWRVLLQGLSIKGKTQSYFVQHSTKNTVLMGCMLKTSIYREPSSPVLYTVLSTKCTDWKFIYTGQNHVWCVHGPPACNILTPIIFWIHPACHLNSSLTKVSSWGLKRALNKLYKFTKSSVTL